MLAVHNIHERELPVPASAVGTLLDALATTDDPLWPRDHWPALYLLPGLAEGARGGHGPIRYTVISHQPGRLVRFRFTAPRGFHGFHEFSVVSGPGTTTILRHTLAMRVRGPARVTWPLVYRWLHDAVLEDCLDRAERATRGTVRVPARWTAWVRLLRWLAMRRGVSRGGSGDRAGKRHAAVERWGRG